MSKITIDEEVLQQLLKQVTTKENKVHISFMVMEKQDYIICLIRYLTVLLLRLKMMKKQKKKLTLFVEQVKKGQFVNTNSTFGDFAQIWLDKKVRPNAGERCVKKYIGALNTRILPYIGNIKLKNLSKQELEKYFNTIKNTKTNYAKRKQNNTVKPDTVKKWKSIIHACLEYVVECEKIPKNPCDKIKITYTNTTDENTIKQLVKSKREKIRYYNIDEYKNVCNLLEKQFLEYYYNDKISNEKNSKRLEGDFWYY